MTNFWALATAVLLLLGGFVAGAAPSGRTARTRAIALASVAALLGSTMLLACWWGGDTVATSLGIGAEHHYLVLAAAANPLICLLSVALAPLGSHQPSTFRSMLCLSAVSSAFLATDEPLVLAALWTASVVLALLEVAQRSVGAARIFAFYQLPGSLSFLAGAVLLARGSTATGAMLVLFGIGIREAAIPGHGWLPSFVEHTPMGVVVCFCLPQLGVYAHLELLHRSLEPALVQAVARVGALSALYGAFLALGQTNVRRIAAYLTMSQTGLVAFGLENHSPIGWSGAVLAWFVQAVGISSFLLSISALEARRGPLRLWQSAGDPHQLPRLGVATLLAGLATVGAPLTLGFVAEDLLVQGSVSEHPVLGLLLVLVTAQNAVTVMRVYFGLFTAGPHRPGELDLGPRELWTLSFALVILLMLGLLPGPLVAFIQ